MHGMTFHLASTYGRCQAKKAAVISSDRLYLLAQEGELASCLLIASARAVVAVGATCHIFIIERIIFDELSTPVIRPIGRRSANSIT